MRARYVAIRDFPDPLGSGHGKSNYSLSVCVAPCRGGFSTLPSRISHLDGVKYAHASQLVTKCAHRGRVLSKGGLKTLPYGWITTNSPPNSNLPRIWQQKAYFRLRSSIWPEFTTGGLGSFISHGMGFGSSCFTFIPSFRKYFLPTGEKICTKRRKPEGAAAVGAAWVLIFNT